MLIIIKCITHNETIIIKYFAIISDTSIYTFFLELFKTFVILFSCKHVYRFLFKESTCLTSMIEMRMFPCRKSLHVCLLQRADLRYKAKIVSQIVSDVLRHICNTIVSADLSIHFCHIWSPRRPDGSASTVITVETTELNLPDGAVTSKFILISFVVIS